MKVTALDSSRQPARSGQDYRLLLLAVDLLTAALVFYVLLIWGPVEWAASDSVVPAAAILLFAWMATLFLWGQYTLYPWRPRLIQAYILTKCMVASTVVAAGLAVLLPGLAPLPTAFYLISASIMLVLTLLVRLAAIRFLPRHMITERYLLLSDGEATYAFWQSLCRVALPRHVEIVGKVLLSGAVAEEDLLNLPLLGRLEDLGELAEQHMVHSLILGTTRSLRDEDVRAIMRCQELGLRVLSPLKAHEEITRRTPLFAYNGLAEASLESAQHGKYSTRLKRVTDVVITLLLLPLGLVLMGLASLAVLLDDGRPVFYRQQRVGKDGRGFSLLKIRTMVPDAEQKTGPIWATANDPRVTRAGHFLRAARVDELPQLFNILRGDMSLVGPRPERPAFVEEFNSRIPFYEQRLLVRPGLTGWAQIHCSYDQELEDVHEKLRYDLFYLRHLSFTLDLQILLATIGVVLSRTGTH